VYLKVQTNKFNTSNLNFTLKKKKKNDSNLTNLFYIKNKITQQFNLDSLKKNTSRGKKRKKILVENKDLIWYFVSWSNKRVMMVVYSISIYGVHLFDTPPFVVVDGGYDGV
jgi:hypothetical protein